MLTTLTFWYIKNWVIVKIYYSFRIVSYLVTNDYGSVTPGCTGTSRNPSFSLQWKSDYSTKHYFTQMLLTINWDYWQAGKKFTHAYGGSRSPHASALHLYPPGFEKNKVGYFSKRVRMLLWYLVFISLYICNIKSAWWIRHNVHLWIQT